LNFAKSQVVSARKDMQSRAMDLKDLKSEKRQNELRLDAAFNASLDDAGNIILSYSENLMPSRRFEYDCFEFAPILPVKPARLDEQGFKTATQKR